MTCRACGAPLTIGARFCASCGTAVAATCPACSAELPDGARFCPACGTPVGGPPAPPGPEAGATGRERKVASLLFADLVGFTSLGATHDPEIVGALVSRVFARLSEEVRRYEGTIEKFAGDAMLAAFGVPALHEDDAERAVRAALEMQAAVAELAVELRAEGRPDLRLRIGIETGEVLVDLTRAAGERDLFVTGDAVNTAARLQAAAAPGAVIVGPVTYTATRALIDYEELPPAVLKGKELPVAAWRAIAVKARRGGERAPLGLEAPLVGRDEELTLLKETLRRAVADGRPHVVTVVGSAGVGKSRLTWELEKYVDGLPEPYHWRKGRCLAYAQASYSALADALKADAGIMDDDAPAAGDLKLEGRLAGLGVEADVPLLDALRAVLALGPASALPRDELFDAWRRYLELVAARAPLVLVLEDIHWADEGLLDFVEYAARWADGPMVFLCLARHELLERRPAWGGGLPNAATIVLEPLDEAESGRLVDGLLSGGLPEPLRSRVVSLADGNPLFAEELVRMFVDRGVLRFADGRWQLAQPVDEVEVPGSIQAVLAARLDTLPASEKRLAQRAAVVGRIFWDAVLAHLMRQGTGPTDELLRRLRVKELVVARSPSSLAGAAEYGFRHVLIRDVAYETLPKRDRAVLHLDVADWAETELAERRDEFVELLGSHYLAALRYEEEFGETGSARLRELRQRTYDTARRASARGEALAEFENATRWLRTAVEVGRDLEVPPLERARPAAEFAEVGEGHASHESMIRSLKEAISAIEAEGVDLDDALHARLEALLTRQLYIAGLADEARVVAGAALERREGGEPSEARAMVLWTLGWLRWRAGPIETAPALLERAIEEARATGSAAVERNAMHDLGVALAFTGRFPEAIPLLRESYRLAQATGDHGLLSRSFVNLPAVLDANGEDWHEVVELLLEGLLVARRAMDRGGQQWVAGNLGDILALLARLDEAVGYQEEALEACRHFHQPAELAMQLYRLALLRRLLGEPEAARTAEAEVAALGVSPEPQLAGGAATHAAWVCWLTDDPAAAVDGLIAALAGLEPLGRLDVASHLARMALRVGRPDVVADAGRTFLELTASMTGPRRALERRWIAALSEDPPKAVPAIEGAAADLETGGWRWLAAEAWADAALLAARRGIRSIALDRARAIVAETGLHLMLGPLPETRWIEIAPSSLQAPGIAAGAADRGP